MTRYGNLSVISLFCATCFAVFLMMSCTKETSTQEFLIDGYRFIVPRKHLLPSQVDWFPNLQPSGGFNFTVDPTLPLTEQFGVGLESRKVRCRPDKLAPGSMLADACASNHEAQQFSDVSDLRKQFSFPNNDAFWNYTVQGPGELRTIVASCYAAVSSKSNDTCSAFGRYKSLVYSFSIEDRNIGNLNERRAYIGSLLSKWDSVNGAGSGASVQ